MVKRLDEIREIIGSNILINGHWREPTSEELAKAIHDSEVERLKPIVNFKVDWQDIMNIDSRDLNGYLIAKREFTDSIEKIKKSLEKR